MDLLRTIAGTHGRWCATVAEECDASAVYPGLTSMTDAHEIFGDPLMLETPQEILDTEIFRISFASPGDPKTKHLGEAETLAIMCSRFRDGAFVTDDKAAARRASAEGIRTYDTWDLLKLSVRASLITVDEGWQYVCTLGGDSLGEERFSSRARFDHWCLSAQHNP